MKKINGILFFFVLFFISCNEEGKKSGDNSGHSNHSATSTGLTYADSLNSGIIPVDTLKGSPHRVAMGNIGGSHVHIEYGSPGVKGRIIWGGLVPLKQVWVAGAHSATSVEFSKEVTIGDKLIAPGKYAFFTIPDSTEWVLILNKNFKQHLTDDYKMEDDVVRVSVKPQTNDSLVQRLTYTVKELEAGKGEIQLQWEKVKLSLGVVAK
jgi:Protein of unknown function (DUF2911)